MSRGPVPKHAGAMSMGGKHAAVACRDAAPHPVMDRGGGLRSSTQDKGKVGRCGNVKCLVIQEDIVLVTMPIQRRTGNSSR